MINFGVGEASRRPHNRSNVWAGLWRMMEFTELGMKYCPGERNTVQQPYKYRNSLQQISLMWCPVMREVQERWERARSLRAVDTVLENMKPVHDEEPEQGYKQRSGVIFLNHKYDLFMTMLRMHGGVRNLEAVKRPELRQWQVSLGWLFEMDVGELTGLD